MICCVTGHRPKGFPFPHGTDCFESEEYLILLEAQITELINSGYTRFISGMAEGADMDFAEIILDLRVDYTFISLEAVLPYPFVMPKNPTNVHFDKQEIIAQSNAVIVVSPCYFRGCLQKRNRYMVDKSDLVLAIWNGERKGGTWDTIKYARKEGKEIRYIMLSELEFLQNNVDKKAKK